MSVYSCVSMCLPAYLFMMVDSYNRTLLSMLEQLMKEVNNELKTNRRYANRQQRPITAAKQPLEKTNMLFGVIKVLQVSGQFHSI